MKRGRGNSELFGMSFLDVICCGFGAMVLLVLLSKTDVVGGAVNLDAVKALLGTLNAEEKRKTGNEEERDRLLAQTRELEVEIRESARDTNLAGVKQRLAEKQAEAKALRNRVNALARRKARAQSPADTAVKVGGIPVDSNYIIFIVDTSGSMQRMWPRVIAELKNVLDIHPKVKGFQIMNDNGVYLINAYAGKWMPDTPGRRKSVLSAMQTWTSFSNSSPVEGLEKALKTYANRTDNLAIYIFGDEYSGSSYDPVLQAIAELNIHRKTGLPIARIHGIGFFWGARTTSRFATLMREVARRNRGAFVALGK